ncbi:cellobiose phosphorylase [Beijerinckiaceae bacterium]|nr:cellobiose phosphorylase [Beijerinckiaceae bacterium]
MPSGQRSWKTPREKDLGLHWIENQAGMRIGVLPNGCLFSIEHRRPGGGATMINQVLGSPIDGGIGRLYLRSGGEPPLCIEIVGPNARGLSLAASDCFVWEGETAGLRHRATLSLHPNETAWLWRLDVTNNGAAARSLDAILIQDLGLGDRGFVMNNEAYASQYIDHYIARHPHCGPVVMSRQNLAQGGCHPWVLHGCLEGASGYATDAIQSFGPPFRASNEISFSAGADLPSERLQYETACPTIQSAKIALAPGSSTAWRFFALYDFNHVEASSEADLARIDGVTWQQDTSSKAKSSDPVRSLIQEAPPAAADPISAADLAHRYPNRLHDERLNGELLSFFLSDPPHNRHVVLRDKELLVKRRHGALLRSGQAILPDEAALCATCWMHGVFGAQLTIGNTSFHKLFSLSRDPYNITHASGLRLLIDLGEGWRLLEVPSVFEIGLSDCRWIYFFGERTIIVRAIASGDDPAMQWRVSVEGDPCRFLVFGHVVLGERELESDSLIEVEPGLKRFSFRPDPNWFWGQNYPNAVYHLVTSTPGAVEALGGDELLYIDGKSRGGAYFALRTRPTQELCFAVAGSMTDAAAALRLAEKFEQGVEDEALLAPARRYWGRVTRHLRITGGGDEGAALNTIFPWLVHNAMIHLTVPHGLEQYTGAAWGTRDVCQGPVEFFLALHHDEPVKQILRIVFAQQYESQGDWPQWFMLEPYSIIQDKVSHGDVIVWPLKALNDYIEATNDLSFLEEKIAWRREDTFEQTEQKESVAVHVEKLLATVRARFIPGTHLIRYGHGDWNDSLQPVDPKMQDWMVSSWTVALLFQQLNRYAEVLRRAGRAGEAKALIELASDMRLDFNHFLVRDDTVAGYGLFEPGGGMPKLLLHPSDTRTGLKYSLLPMTRSILGGLFTPEQTEHHLRLIRDHLLFPDGARLIDRPVAYHGGPQTVFQRAESSAFFGREIGLMYVHAHLRYAEAMAVLGEAEALWEALQLASPLAVTDRLSQATLRQRNAYFSSSDAAFTDRYAASANYGQIKAGTIGLDGGWRIYSSGPGLYTGILVCDLLGQRRRWGQNVGQPLLPTAYNDVTGEMIVDPTV